MSLNVNSVAECLTRCHWDEILSIKICFMHIQKEKIRASGKLLKLVLGICFFVKIESCLNEDWMTEINGFDIAIEQKTFLWNAF